MACEPVIQSEVLTRLDFASDNRPAEPLPGKSDANPLQSRPLCFQREFSQRSKHERILCMKRLEALAALFCG
jgi:hypothetical protein